ncbi:unnamed protein product [Phytophthora fragariaefolia]|uniref:Unnamed protein product n=1 Tax=Phytophthora fragariaefolia TaxID=1490495 RepID=A0A9W6TZH1_9STRA|nr:unnamed protein product [Phytophthora fragariaefolia]
MPPAADAQRLKLVLRVHSAEELQHSSSQGAYCKLYVGPTAVTEGSHKALSKRDSGDSAASAEDDDAWRLEVRRTRTAHQQPNALAPPETIWDETFEVPLRAGLALAAQILSVRVKSQHLFFCPVIGACAVSLANLRVGERLEQWFPLLKGKKPAGRIRVMLLIAPEDHVLKARRKLPNQDVMAARAANHEADEAIKRLVEKQLRQEAERRQRRLERTSSGPPVEVKRPEDGELPDKMHELHVGYRHKRGENATWPPPPGVSSPKMLPPLGTPAVFRDNQDVESPKANPSPTEQLPVSPLSEYEQRLDRKLRQVRKETARLRKLKSQLKKYIPDLQMDSDSDDSLDSDEEPEALLTGSSVGSSSSSSSASEKTHHLSDHVKETAQRRSHGELKLSRVKSAETKAVQTSKADKQQPSPVAF